MKTEKTDNTGNPITVALHKNAPYLWAEPAQMVFGFLDAYDSSDDKNLHIFVHTCESCLEQGDFKYCEWKSNGRKPASRVNIAKALIYKALYNIPTTKELVRQLKQSTFLARLCGWSSPGKVPSEASFSRVFKEITDHGYADEWFSRIIERNLKGVAVRSVSYDSAPVLVHAAAKTPEQKEIDKAKNPPPEKGRLAEQLEQEPNEALENLPHDCDFGQKIDSNGKKKVWKGGKLHIGVCEFGIPVVTAFTSASLHDSQVIIPMVKVAARRLPHKYDLADAAYDSKLIRMNSSNLGMTAIIDRNKRKSKTPPPEMTAEEKKIYNDRSGAERYFSQHLDWHGGRNIRVKDPAKVATHLLFGTIIIAMKQILIAALIIS